MYALPLPYHYTNSIKFTGKCTANGTLTVTVNSVDITFSITNKDTAIAVADKFRIAAESSSDFITDELGSGSIVNILSKKSSTEKSAAYAQVNIGDITTVEGIGGTVAQRLKRYPVMIEQIAAEIATALLLIDIYGVESQDTGKDGQTRMEIINATLQKLQGVHESKQRINIFDEVTGAEIATTTSLDVISYPNNTSDTDPTDPTSPRTWVNQEF